MRNITPCLWFDGTAEQAVAFYHSVFPETRILDVLRYGAGAPMPEGTVLTITFTLRGQEFVAMNGGPHYAPTPGISFFVHCDTQEEIDRLWDRLAEGGKPIQCGWITDRFGITWQIVPHGLLEMLQDKDKAKSARVMQALMGMVKLDAHALRAAYDAA